MPKPDFTTPTGPGKPYEGFPLFAHSNGQWAKKIRGRTHYFGPWDDHHAALRRFLAEEEDLKAGLHTSALRNQRRGPYRAAGWPPSSWRPENFGSI